MTSKCELVEQLQAQLETLGQVPDEDKVSKLIKDCRSDLEGKDKLIADLRAQLIQAGDELQESATREAKLEERLESQGVLESIIKSLQTELDTWKDQKNNSDKVK